LVRKVGPGSGWRNEEEGYAVVWSGEYEVIENFWIPTWIEFTTFGSDDPDTLIRVELRDGSPQVVRLDWTSQPGQREIKEKHLRRHRGRGFRDRAGRDGHLPLRTRDARGSKKHR
jgi:hypothetical protein